MLKFSLIAPLFQFLRKMALCPTFEEVFLNFILTLPIKLNHILYKLAHQMIKSFRAWLS